MSKAIGMIEFKTTATGITAADTMVKTSDVEIVEAQTSDGPFRTDKIRQGRTDGRERSSGIQG